MRGLIDTLFEGNNLTNEELKTLIECEDNSIQEEYLFKQADKKRRQIYGEEIYIRGLIEISNYCKNNCLYCGIRCSNLNVERYRLSQKNILDCVSYGYSLGFRTFVMQGGEDLHFSDKEICQIVSKIKKSYPDCAVTLSIGEKDKQTYQDFFNAGADRYLLRHETATEEHYTKLHPSAMKLEKRKQCLFDLKEIGFQVGSGFMVGSPFQTTENIIADLRFLQELQPDMIGIGPFIPHIDTPFKDKSQGDLHKTLRLVAILRLMFPYSLIPSTTALGSIAENGRELGLQVGANVVMPNLSPTDVRKLYNLYNNKAFVGKEAVEGLEELKNQVNSLGYKIVVSRGDAKRNDK